MEYSTLTLAVISTTVLLFSCASVNLEKSIEEIAEEIDELVGNAEADSIEQCSFMPIGVKPAGGPWGYLIYSTKNINNEKLDELVTKYNELDAQRNEETDSFSTADVATEPTLQVQDGKCFGEGRYAWNPGEVRDNT